MPVRTNRRDVLFAAAAAGLASVPARADEAPGPAYRSATELVRALAARETTSIALTEAAIARIEAMDRKVNAVVVRDFDRARAAAAEADAALDRGERRPLLGLPMTVKEQFNVQALPTTWGLKKFRDWRPRTDALAVQRLKAAGAVILGKTNVPVNLGDWQSYNDVYGTTNNPWDTARTPGGSSGGAAAALAAGFVPLELGSDLGGSLRAPAHFCGVMAHKPSIELIPQRGAGYPDTPAIPARGDLAVIGPMARSAADLRLALGVLAGPDELWDGIGYRLDLPPPRRTSLGDFRVLVLLDHPLCPTEARVRKPLAALAENLAELGCSVAYAHPGAPDLARTSRVYQEILMASFAADLTPEEILQNQAAVAALAPDDPGLEAARLRGLAMSHAFWIRTGWIREGLRARWQALFKDVDVILCPPMPTVAFPHDHGRRQGRTIDVDGTTILYNRLIAWSALATLNGFPATVAPIGRSDSGLPVGVQIVGGYLSDLTTLAFAEALERQFGGFAPPPAFT